MTGRAAAACACGSLRGPLALPLCPQLPQPRRTRHLPFSSDSTRTHRHRSRQHVRCNHQPLTHRQLPPTPSPSTCRRSPAAVTKSAHSASRVALNPPWARTESAHAAQVLASAQHRRRTALPLPRPLVLQSQPQSGSRRALARSRAVATLDESTRCRASPNAASMTW